MAFYKAPETAWIQEEKSDGLIEQTGPRDAGAHAGAEQEVPHEEAALQVPGDPDGK